MPASSSSACWLSRSRRGGVLHLQAREKPPSPSLRTPKRSLRRPGSRFAGKKASSSAKRPQSRSCTGTGERRPARRPNGSKRCGCWFTISTRANGTRVAFPGGCCAWRRRITSPSQRQRIDLETDHVKLTLEGSRAEGTRADPRSERPARFRSARLDRVDGSTSVPASVTNLRPSPRSAATHRPRRRTDTTRAARFHKEIHRLFLAFPLNHSSTAAWSEGHYVETTSIV